MRYHQPDEIGSGAPSGAGASGEPVGDYLQRDNILFNKYSTPTRNSEPSSGTAPNSMPTTIKVNESEESEMSSSIPGLGSSMDMSMNAMTTQQEITLVKQCVTTKMFSFWKFYSSYGDGQFTHDPTEMCGYLIRNTPKTKKPRNEQWWLEMRKHVTTALTNHRNNVIKSCMNKFKGKQSVRRFRHSNKHTHLLLEQFKKGVTGTRYNLQEGSIEELNYLQGMRENICHYANIIDEFAPCIVLSKVWNDDVKMNHYCNTSDKKLWAHQILSNSDEAFLLLVLINYTKRWIAEITRNIKEVSVAASLHTFQPV